jgi:hypothetical protein
MKRTLNEELSALESELRKLESNDWLIWRVSGGLPSWVRASCVTEVRQEMNGEVSIIVAGDPQARRVERQHAEPFLKLVGRK